MRADLRGMWQIVKYGTVMPFYIASCRVRGCDWIEDGYRRLSLTTAADAHVQTHLVPNLD